MYFIDLSFLETPHRRLVMETSKPRPATGHGRARSRPGGPQLRAEPGRNSPTGRSALARRLTGGAVGAAPSLGAPVADVGGQRRMEHLDGLEVERLDAVEQP